MKRISRRFIQMLTISLTAFLLISSEFLATVPAAAQAAPPAQDADTANERPFQLPFAEPPSPDTWLMAQPYGNTTGAYRRRFSTYGASGGIHFGVDLSAPCGTEIVAIADGVVFAVDGPFGSPPHNLMIDHPELGYASMYGHLLKAPDLVPGQTVKQGEVVALVGDSGETCYSRPHLHLEIRDLGHTRKYNPQMLIEANWDNLALISSSGRDFARDLAEPRKWQSLYDQPEVQTGGPIVNDFANAWPLDWEKTAVPRPETVMLASFVSLALPAATPLAEVSESAPAVGRQITVGNCCTSPAWSKDSTQVRFIDQPTGNSALGVWGIDVTRSLPETKLVSDWLGVYSPDETLAAYPAGDVTIIERLADGQRWEIDTQGRRPVFTPDSRRILWSVYDEDAPRDNRVETVWLADVDGSNAQVILSASRTDLVGWLSADTLLLARRVPGSSDETLISFAVDDGRERELLTIPEPRGLAFSPDKRYLVYYVTFEPEAAKNGLWLLDLGAARPVPQKLPFFGTYRWRDNERLVYVPFDPEATEHNFYEYNVATGSSRALFPEGTNLTIANNDWHISPDGARIALVEANGAALNGIWVLDID